MELAIKKISFPIKKKWIIRLAALVIFTLCYVTLSNLNLYRPLHIRVMSGLVNSFFLNITLLICAVKIPTGKLRYLLAFGIVFSGLAGVFLIIPFGWPVAAISLIFHLWLAYKLVSRGGLK